MINAGFSASQQRRRLLYIRDKIPHFWRFPEQLVSEVQTSLRCLFLAKPTKKLWSFLETSNECAFVFSANIHFRYQLQLLYSITKVQTLAPACVRVRIHARWGPIPYTAAVTSYRHFSRHWPSAVVTNYENGCTCGYKTDVMRNNFKLAWQKAWKTRRNLSIY